MSDRALVKTKRTTKGSVDEWPPLKHSDLMRIFGVHCRTRTRVDQMHAPRPREEEHSISIACGRLTAFLLKLREQAIGNNYVNDGRILIQSLAAQAKTRDPHISLDKGGVGQFLNGRPKSRANDTEFWLGLTWDWMEDVLLGTNRTLVAEDQQKAFELIRTYFLGERRGEEPPYLDLRRAWCRAPFTREEAVDGLRHLALRQELSKGRGRVVFVSVDPPFLHEDMFELANVLAQVASSGLKIFFVYYTSSRAGSCIDRTSTQSVSALFEAIRRVAKEVDPKCTKRMYDVAIEPTSVNRASGSNTEYYAAQFVDRFALHTYVEHVSGESESEQDLYITHTGLSPEQAKWHPFSTLAGTQQTQAFAEWLDAFIPKRPLSLADAVRRDGQT